MSAPNPYSGAYPELPGRRAVWGAIARYVARDAPDVGLLVELGCGYGDFSRQFPAKRKLAFDLDPEMRRFAAPDVELRVEPTQFDNVGRVMASPWRFRGYGQSGLLVSDLFPHVARRADDLCVMELLYARSKDVPDLERMFAALQLDLVYIREWVTKMAPPGDRRFVLLDDLERRFVQRS